MRWLVFIVVGLLAVALETSFVDWLFTLPALGEVYPSLVGVLVVFVALFAPRATALWAAWGLGLLLDLTLPEPSDLLVVGPHALGFVAGTCVVLYARAMVFRRRALTIGLLTLACLLAAGVVEVTVHTVRLWLGDAALYSAGFHPAIELLRRIAIALYSALLALPVGWMLVRTLPVWGFQRQR